LEEIEEALKPILEQLKPIQEKVEDWRARVEETYQRIADDLEAEAPVAEEISWPEPAEGDEHPDPLFDSTRTYLDQMDVYKRNQGKPTARRPRSPNGQRRQRRLGVNRAAS
jgi:hypothetical protein